MTDYSFFYHIPALIAATVAIVVLFLSLRLPPILGYLTVGVLMGPYGLGLIADTEHTRAFAEFGVVFLLFSIGLEFSLPLLMRMRGAVLGLGGLQVLLCTVITAIVAVYVGVPFEASIVLGGVVAMSSTALVTSQLSDQVELHFRHGLNAVGILLFQDIMVVPFLIIVASLTSPAQTSYIPALITALVHGTLALLLILVAGRWIMRPLFKAIARFHSDELFTLTTLLVILASAWATHYMGLSLALGAFVAGMLLGETEFRHQLQAEIRPFKDVLLGLFFITVGMLFDIHLLPEIWVWVLLLLFALVIFKLFLIAGLCRLAGWDAAVSMRTGLVLAHGGEFGFAILTLALAGGLMPQDYGQVVLAALLISMAVAPLLIRFNSQLVSWVLPRAASMTLDAIKGQIAETAHGLHGHVILCGYGRVGQRVARFLEAEGIKYIAMDIDPFLVENAVKAGEPVSYGNASNVDLIKAAGLSSAAVVVFCLDDVHSVLKALPELRRINSTIPVLVRTEDDALLDQLQEAGATEVVPATMEASLMLSSHVLLLLNVPGEKIMNEIRKIRQDRYALLRQLFPGEKDIIEGTDSETKG